MNLQPLNTIIKSEILEFFSEPFQKFHIDSVNRVSHFFAQVKHESLNFTVLTENLNYSGIGLRKIFPKYFPDNLIAESYQRQPQKIANRIYANRMGNGNELSNDGWKYRGRGYIQLTGKSNYIGFGTDMGESVVNNPDIVATPKYAAISACWFFWKNGLNELADLGTDDSVITKITLRINGGLNGLSERIKNFQQIYAILKNCNQT